MKTPLVWLPLAMLVAGCAAPPETESAATAPGAEDPSASATLAPETFEGEVDVLVGVDHPGGCDGQHVNAGIRGPFAWTYEVPADARRALVTLTAESPAPARYLLCVLDLEVGTYAVPGPSPLTMEVPFANETAVGIAVFAANDPASAVVAAKLHVLVEPFAG